MVKKAIEIKREYGNKTRNKLVVLGVEGINNKTENLYFSELAKKAKNWKLNIINDKTDPIGIVNNVANKAIKEELEPGDLAIAMFDVDNDESKRKQIKEAKNIAKESKYNVEVLTSNPCFEVWYLEHFGYTTKPFKNGKDVEKELSKYIDGYQKNYCPFEKLYANTKIAILNSEKLRKYNKEYSIEKNENYYNPSTNVDLLVKRLIK